MSARSTAHWKNAEKRVAQLLGGTRINRGQDFSETAPDVVSEHFVVDVKSYARHAAARIFKACRAKYIGEGDERAFLLVLHERGQGGDYVVLDINDFVRIARAGGYI